MATAHGSASAFAIVLRRSYGNRIRPMSDALSALRKELADVTNPYAGIRFAAPAAAALEHSLVRWMADLVGYPETAGGDLTSGASVATLEAIVTAREARAIAVADVDRTVVYLTEQTHHC